MKAAAIVMRGLAWIIIAMLVVPPGIPAQDAVQPEQPEKFMKEELVQMLAPIALYPDSLTAQILMAATYPIEIVEAERWLKKNSHLKGDALDNAIKEKTWGPSVKSICHFPDILYSLSEKLDQTQKLGDAFLSQEDEVMATIQELRQKAREQGNLTTTKEHKVIIEREIIRIEPSEPEVVYVPVYDPLYVYGPWWYPAYPPYYWYYPSGIVYGSFIHFRPGFYFTVSIFPWCWFDWHRHHIYIDVIKLRRFHKHTYGRRGVDGTYWRHDPSHRRGVVYRDRRTRERFGVKPPAISPRRSEKRGYPPKDAGSPQRRSPSGTDERRRGPDAPGDRKDRERPVKERSDRDPGDRRGTERPDNRQEKRIAPGSERRAGDSGDVSRQDNTVRRQAAEPEQKGSGAREGDGTRGAGRGGETRR